MPLRALGRDFPGSGSSAILVPVGPRHATKRFTMCAWSRAEGAGSVVGRVTERLSQQRTYYSAWASSELVFEAIWSTTPGAWRFPTVANNNWVHHVAAYDGTSTANVPTIWVNGKSVSLTLVQGPVGTFTPDATSDLYIGNRAAGDRCWDGQLAGVGMWDRLLTGSEAMRVYRLGPPAVPRGLLEYIPIAGEAALASNHVGRIGRVTATSPTDLRPPVYRPSSLGGTEVFR